MNGGDGSQATTSTPNPGRMWNPVKSVLMSCVGVTYSLGSLIMRNSNRPTPKRSLVLTNRHDKTYDDDIDNVTNSSAPMSATETNMSECSGSRVDNKEKDYTTTTKQDALDSGPGTADGPAYSKYGPAQGPFHGHHTGHQGEDGATMAAANPHHEGVPSYPAHVIDKEPQKRSHNGGGDSIIEQQPTDNNSREDKDIYYKAT